MTTKQFGVHLLSKLFHNNQRFQHGLQIICDTMNPQKIITIQISENQNAVSML